jgi:hypothetical protein
MHIVKKAECGRPTWSFSDEFGMNSDELNSRKAQRGKLVPTPAARRAGTRSVHVQIARRRPSGKARQATILAGLNRRRRLATLASEWSLFPSASGFRKSAGFKAHRPWNRRRDRRDA